MKSNYSKNGVKFSTLVHGEVRNYCCDNFVSLDPDVLQLLNPDTNIMDQFRHIQMAQSRKIVDQLELKYLSYIYYIIKTQLNASLCSINN